MKKKHGLAWWLCIGWWWYLVFAWWVYPIKWLFSRKTTKVKPGMGEDSDTDSWYQMVSEAETLIVDSLKRNDSGAALQVDIKKSLPERLIPCFDEAVHELYEEGKIKTSKDGNRVRLELA